MLVQHESAPEGDAPLMQLGGSVPLHASSLLKSEAIGWSELKAGAAATSAGAAARSTKATAAKRDMPR